MARATALIWWLAGFVLVAALPAAWGMSYLRGDTILWLRGGRRSIAVASWQGRVAVLLTDPARPGGPPPQLVHLHDDHFAETIIGWDVDSGLPIHGNSWLHYTTLIASDSFLGQGGIVVVLPHCLLGLPGLLVMAVSLRRGVRRWRRKRLGLCLVCGYDLRESRERCPECGTAVALRGPRRTSATSSAPSP